MKTIGPRWEVPAKLVRLMVVHTRNIPGSIRRANPACVPSRRHAPHIPAQHRADPSCRMYCRGGFRFRRQDDDRGIETNRIQGLFADLFHGKASESRLRTSRRNAVCFCIHHAELSAFSGLLPDHIPSARAGSFRANHTGILLVSSWAKYWGSRDGRGAIAARKSREERQRKCVVA